MHITTYIRQITNNQDLTYMQYLVQVHDILIIVINFTKLQSLCLCLRQQKSTTSHFHQPVILMNTPSLGFNGA